MRTKARAKMIAKVKAEVGAKVNARGAAAGGNSGRQRTYRARGAPGGADTPHTALGGQQRVARGQWEAMGIPRGDHSEGNSGGQQS